MKIDGTDTVLAKQVAANKCGGMVRRNNVYATGVVIKMKETEFKNQYWKQYIMIEKEFKSSIRYNAIDISNFSSYSDVYAKLLLQTGSEVDVVAKALCKEINITSISDTIQQYQLEICTRFPEFDKVTVSCGDLDLCPWSGWTATSPIWWKTYNGVKHNRNKIETYGSETRENYKFANQGNTINALAGLFQLEQYLYSVITHTPGEETPLPGSRLFKLKDQGWETVHFGQDLLLYVKNGCLHSIVTDTLYSDI